MSKRRGLPNERGMRHTHHYVDELFNRDDHPLGRHLPISSLEVNPDQPRTSVGEVDDLAESIKSHGILEPLLVHRVEEGRYRIIAGERRFHAAMKLGLTEVPCIEMEILNESEILEIALIENLQRRDLNPFEESHGYQTLKNKYNYTHDKIAKTVGKSRSTITESLTLSRIPDEIRELCRHADISAKSILLEIAKADDLMDMRNLVDLYAAGGDRQAMRELRKGTEADPEEEDSDQYQKLRPFVFRVSPQEGHFSLSLKFQKQEVSRDEIIKTLQQIIEQLRRESVPGPSQRRLDS
ncbi:MAG TPA: ParB/RepB/Spo0J family partition protein [Thermoanaerobaculia bacterium]|nr:ParB/RepB/Spo0J family partition protein [Thermoanaerobaculia bacterium]HUM29976.1 ParB/RepB/Spo0J family partition protein [Thermoanaerobaculia bacterium]HXK68157.1 ParB/RepB/Spo0J family partition protein [Thermoanaerobaculia bacterium]